MAALRQACSVRFTILLLVGAVIGGGTFAATASAASDPVAELGAQVEKVTEALPPPVRTVVGTAVQPVHTVTGTVTAPADSAAVAGAADEAGQTAHHAEDGVTQTAGAAGAVSRETLAAPVAPAGAGAAVQDAAPIAAPKAQTAPPSIPATPPPAPSDVEASAPSSAPTSVGAEPKGVDPETADARNSMASRAAQDPAPGPGQDTFEAPSVDGSIRAPFTRLVAYVWPAIALGRSSIGELLGPWTHDALALASASADGSAAPSGALGIAGAHAEHPPQQQPFSLRSLLEGLPSVDANWTPGVPLPVLFCFLGVALGTLAVFLTMLWDLGVLGELRDRGLRQVGRRGLSERRP